MSPRRGRSKKEYPPMMNKNGELVSRNEEKAEVLNNFLVSVFTGNLYPRPFRVDGPQDGNEGVKPLPL